MIKLRSLASNDAGEYYEIEVDFHTDWVEDVKAYKGPLTDPVVLFGYDIHFIAEKFPVEILNNYLACSMEILGNQLHITGGTALLRPDEVPEDIDPYVNEDGVMEFEIILPIEEQAVLTANILSQLISERDYL